MRATPRSSFLLVAGALLLSAGSAFAVDSVDLQVLAPAKVKGTIRDVTERESFVIDIPKDAAISASAKAKGKTGPVPVVELLNSDLQVIATGAVKGRASSIKGFLAPASDEYRIRVSGDQIKDGDYQLKITVKPKTKFVGQGTAAGSQLDNTFTFGSPAGATARVQVKAANGSGFVPSLTSVTGPDGFQAPLTGTGSAPPIVLGAAGDYTVHFDDSGTGGDWTCTVTLTPKKTLPTSVDISAGALTGSFVSAQPVYGRTIDDSGGVLDPPDLGSPLDGCSCSIPPGALGLPVVLSIAESQAFFAGANVHETGPVVKFAPNGTTFSSAVTVTLTFDPDQYDDPVSELTIYVLNEDTGTVEPVEKPYDFSGGPGVVMFPTLHFSTYMTSNTLPRTMDGTWRVVRLAATSSFAFGSDVSASTGEVTINGGTLTGGSIQGLRSSWSPGTGTPSASSSFETFSDLGNSVNVVDDRTIEISGGNDTRQFRRGWGNDAIAYAGIEGEVTDLAETILMFKRPRAAPSRSNITGAFRYVLFRAGAEFKKDDIVLGAEVVRGTAVFASNGFVTFADDSGRIGQSLFPAGDWKIKPDGGAVVARWSPEFGGVNIVLSRDAFDIDAEEFDVFPILSGEGLVGVVGDAFQPASDVGVIVLLRQGTNVKSDDLEGNSPFVAFAAETVDRTDSVQGIHFAAHTASADRGVEGNRINNVNAFRVFHDTQGMGMFGTVSENDILFNTYSVAPTGLYKSSDGVFGLVSRRGDFLAGLREVDGAFRFHVELVENNPAGPSR